MEFSHIGLACDHNGLVLKNEMSKKLTQMGISVRDYGSYNTESVDYPDYAKLLCLGIQKGEVEAGIAICGTGIGMSIACNKFRGIRAACSSIEEHAKLARQHNNANVLCLGAKDQELKFKLLEIFVTTAFEGGRHQRRVDKITALELPNLPNA